MSGLSLIEMMIALVLGLLVVAAAGSIFQANKNTFKATESLGRVQENSRLAFELMTRDIREARGSACGSSIIPDTMLNSTSWWNDLPNGIVGYDTLTGYSAAGTDAIRIVSATGDTYAINAMTASTDNITPTATTNDILKSDILQICDFQCATIFQSTSANNATAIAHAKSGTPGNSDTSLNCAAKGGAGYAYGVNAVLSEVSAEQWYVANNTVGGKSLYRAQVLKGVLTAGQEIVEGVTDMQLTYLMTGGTAYQTATDIAADAVPAGCTATTATIWKCVVAVRIDLTLQGTDKVGTNGELLSRTLSHVVYLRNQNL
jgi:type IV pilus assembly protein PilW